MACVRIRVHVCLCTFVHIHAHPCTSVCVSVASPFRARARGLSHLSRARTIYSQTLRKRRLIMLPLPYATGLHRLLMRERSGVYHAAANTISVEMLKKIGDAGGTVEAYLCQRAHRECVHTAWMKGRERSQKPRSAFVHDSPLNEFVHNSPNARLSLSPLSLDPGMIPHMRDVAHRTERLG